MDNSAKFPLDSENQAQHLMDELFSEIEKITDQDDSLLTTSAELVKPSSSSLVVESASIEKANQEVSQLEQPPIADVLFQEIESTLEPERTGLLAHLDKFLFVSSCLCLLAVITWLVKQEKLKISPILVQPEPTLISKNQVSPQDREFANYLLESLETLKQKSPPEKQLQTQTEESDRSKPTNIPNTKKSKNTQQKIVERVYIPIFPPEQSLPNPNPPVSPPIKPQPITPPAPTQKILIPPPPVVSEPKDTSPVVKPEIKAEINTEQTIPAPTQSTPIAITSAHHTLVGLLALGDKSAALFESNGITQRIYPGESIGNSGWQLISIQGQQVIINRNGKERSIYVGEKF